MSAYDIYVHILLERNSLWFYFDRRKFMQKWPIKHRENDLNYFFFNLAHLDSLTLPFDGYDT